MTEYPHGICISPDGEEVYVTDTLSHSVQILRIRDGSHLRSLGGYGHNVGQLTNPTGVCLSGDVKKLYIVDNNNHRIQVYIRARHDINWCHLQTFGSSNLYYPYGICISPDGEKLYVTDARNHRIQVFREDGGYVQTFGSKGNTPGQFELPSGVCISLDGEKLYVSDSANNRVQVLDALDGTPVQTIGSGILNQPTGICISPNSDELYVADTYNHRIQVFRLDGSHVRMIGGGLGNGPGQFMFPKGVCIPTNGELYVTDEKRIQVFQLDFV